MTVRPVTSDRQRPSLVKKQTRKTIASTDSGLDVGIAFTDTDGSRLVVRMGDVKGSHEAKLRGIIGMGFMELLSTSSTLPSLDLLAALVWFGRLVNGRDPGDYLEMLEEFGYGDIEGFDMDEATPEDASPEA